MTFHAILPSIDTAMTVDCVATLCPEILANGTVVNNTVNNRGVPASWNIGAQRVLDEGLDWLVVLSAGIRFGPAGGQDLIDQLDDHPFDIAVEADDGLGWHCIAFNSLALRPEGAGLFDERFFPAYYEDNDWAYRAYCRYHPSEQGPWWPKVKVDVRLAEVAHGLKRAGVKVDMMGNLAKYEAKHGGPPGKEAYRSTHGQCPGCGQFWEDCRGTHELIMDES